MQLLTVRHGANIIAPKCRRLSIPALFAFLIIYFVWGSTFLAIRVTVSSVPPLFAAALRFTIAGAVLIGWSFMRGHARPARRQWTSLLVLGALMFCGCYSALFWAQKFVDSGITAVIESMIPVWTALIGFLAFRDRLQKSLIIAIALGAAGVALLASGRGFHTAPLWPCAAILGAEISWSLGTVLAQKLPLPDSKTMNAGWQMLFGGLMLFVCSGFAGELHPLPVLNRDATAAILYLILAGSIVAFTAYLWLLRRFSAPVVASYAYVNPVIALALGHCLAHEFISTRALFGSALVLAGVIALMLPNSTRALRS